MRLLYHVWNALGVVETARYFQRAGIEVTYFQQEIQDTEQKKYSVDEHYEALGAELKKKRYDAVFSWNYFSVDAIACNENDIPYIAWVYDCPLEDAFIKNTLPLKTNYMFCFDRDQTEEYQKIAQENVFYLPLGTDGTRYSHMILNVAEEKKYCADISFVGQLYPSAAGILYNDIQDEKYRKIWDDAVNLQSKIYKEYFINRIFTQKICEAAFPDFRNRENLVMMVTKNIARSITSDERTLLLALLAKEYEVKLYTRPEEKSDILKRVNIMGVANNVTEAPKVYACSKINLNITLRSISSGIPLRVLDIMSCGGFVLSNYQKELEEYYKDGEDIALYESILEAKEKADYYLSHEAERSRIAQKGYQKTCELFDYSVQFPKIWEKVGLKDT